MEGWFRKADGDLAVAERLAPEVGSEAGFREAVGFHCQQAVEKYIKALLTFYQVEFPKTHEIAKLLGLLRGANAEAADALAGANWLTPYGVDVRYPDDAPQMLPGDEIRAIAPARLAKAVARRVVSTSP